MFRLGPRIYRAQHSRFKAASLELRILNLEFRIWGLGLRIRVEDVEFKD